jgi:hypothetical protein
VTAALCAGGPSVFAQSPEPIDPPDPKRIVVGARPVTSQEFIVYDPIDIEIGSTRPIPEPIAAPDERRVAIVAGMESIYRALPVRMRTIVSARMEDIDIAVPNPQWVLATAKMEVIDPPMPSQRIIDLRLQITEADLEMPVPRHLSAVIRRHALEVELITEPLVMTAVIQRRMPIVVVRHRN